jgi:hypothetical protein
VASAAATSAGGARPARPSLPDRSGTAAAAATPAAAELAPPLPLPQQQQASSLGEARLTLEEDSDFSYCPARGAFAGRDVPGQRARRNAALTAALRAWLTEGGYEAAGLPVGTLLDVVNPSLIVLETNPGSARLPRLQLAMSMWVLWLCLAVSGRHPGARLGPGAHALGARRRGHIVCTSQHTTSPHVQESSSSGCRVHRAWGPHAPTAAMPAPPSPAPCTTRTRQ